MRRRTKQCWASGLPEAINWAHYNPNSLWGKRKSRFFPARPDVDPECGRTQENPRDVPLGMTGLGAVQNLLNLNNFCGLRRRACETQDLGVSTRVSYRTVELAAAAPGGLRNTR